MRMSSAVFLVGLALLVWVTLSHNLAPPIQVLIAFFSGLFVGGSLLHMLKETEKE